MRYAVSVQRIEAKIDDGEGRDNGDAVAENDVTTVVLVDFDTVEVGYIDKGGVWVPVRCVEGGRECFGFGDLHEV